MFEDLRDLWRTYCAAHSDMWPPPDVRADLAAEVQNRLEQLDLLLEHLNRALTATRPDPLVSRQEAADILLEAARYQNGEITEEQYLAFIGRLSQPHVSLKAWSEIRLFTEAFYFFAWRIHEILAASGPRALPGIVSFSAPGIRTVRNLLLEHPEHRRPDPLYVQSLIVTDDGPVLKSSAVLIKDGRAVADPDSIDRGLFRNAAEFRDAIRDRVVEAMSKRTTNA